MATESSPAPAPGAPSWRRFLFPGTVLVALASVAVMYQLNGGLLAGLGYFYQPFAYVAVALVVTLGFRFVLDRLTPYDDTADVVDRKIGPVGLQRGALYVALFIGMSGSLMARPHVFYANVGVFAVDAVIMAVALIVSTWVTDKYLLLHVKNSLELEAGNWSVAIVETGAYLALGFILNGAFAGVGGGWLSGLEFWVIGQGTLAGLYGLYEWRTRCDVDIEIRNRNVALGIEVGGFLLAMGIIERFAIVGPFTGWWRDIVSYLEALVPGLIAIAIVLWFVDLAMPRITLRGKPHHGNIAASLVFAGVAVGAAVLIGAALSEL